MPGPQNIGDLMHSRARIKQRGSGERWPELRKRGNVLPTALKMKTRSSGKRRDGKPSEVSRKRKGILRGKEKGSVYKTNRSAETLQDVFLVPKNKGSLF